MKIFSAICFALFGLILMTNVKSNSKKIQTAIKVFSSVCFVNAILLMTGL